MSPEELRDKVEVVRTGTFVVETTDGEKHSVLAGKHFCVAPDASSMAFFVGRAGAPRFYLADEISALRPRTGWNWRFWERKRD